MTRAELYELVWQQPVYLLAARFGMSGRGLAKTCARHDIPIPQRGYWAKHASGKGSAKPPLPSPERNDPVSSLKGFDALGNRFQAGGSDEWVIPGVLKRILPEPSPTPGQEPGPPTTTARAVAPTLRRRPKPAPAANSKVSKDPAAVAESAPAANALNACGSVARRGQYEQALAFAAVRQAHGALNVMLDALESSARDCDMAARTIISEWIQVVRAEMLAADPLALLIAQSKAIAAGAQAGTSR